MKVVINVEFGGFQVSKELYEELGILWDGYGFLGNNDFGINSEDVYAYRAAPELIGAIEKLGTELSGNKSALEIVEVPDGASYEINDYAGREMIINVKEKAETFETGRFGIKRHKCCPVCEGVGGIPVAGRTTLQDCLACAGTGEADTLPGPSTGKSRHARLLEEGLDNL